jgi:hypothetical protein
MTEFIPYFAGLITVLFSTGFFMIIREANKTDYSNKAKKD